MQHLTQQCLQLLCLPYVFDACFVGQHLLSPMDKTCIYSCLKSSINLPFKAQICLMILIFPLSATPKHIFFRNYRGKKYYKPYID